MKREKKTAAAAWLETWNPLRGMSIRDAQALFDASRRGDTQRLHWLFQEIEATNPVLLVCVDRRSSAIANFRWKVSEIASRNGQLSAEQKDAAERLLNGIVNLTDTLEHLDLAFFRGFAHAQPIWEADGTVREISLLDSWKFVRHAGEWWYNPKCTGIVDGDMQTTRDARLMSVVRKRPIDYPALGLHIRHAVGSRDWGRFLERYALPKPAVFMHAGATKEQRGDYLEAAQSVENGQVSVWPNGASLTDFAGGARGTDPFASFIEHQEKQIVLLATGGTLMSLAEAGAGTLAGNAQSDVWRSIVARDASVIAQSVQRSLVEPYLREAFGGRPVSVAFGFDFSEPPTAKEVFEVAALAKQAGWTIDQGQLEEKTGYTLVKDETPAPAAPGLFANKAADIPSADATERVPPVSDVLAAFAADTSPVAKALQAVLKNPSKEAINNFLDDLPTLLNDDHALAAVIAEEMAKQFTDPAGQKMAAGRHTDSQDSQALTNAARDTGYPASANNEDQPRGKTSPGSTPGSFAPAAGGGESTSTDKNPDASDDVKAFLKEVPKKIKPEQADKILTEGFTDHDGSGNDVHYGQLLLDHINQDSRNQNDRDARKIALGQAMQMIRKTSPIKSSRPGDKERVYFGLVDGKAYIAVADEHSEINAMEMVSYRRDGRRDER